jgi:hypothetical protein
MKRIKEAFGQKQLPLLSPGSARRADAVKILADEPAAEKAIPFSPRSKNLSAADRFYLSPKTCKDLLERSAIKDERIVGILKKALEKRPPM